MKDAQPDEAWRKDILWGILSLAVTGYLFWYFTDFEQSEDETRSMNTIFALLYNLGGKYLVCGITLLLSLFFLREGISKYRFYNK